MLLRWEGAILFGALGFGIVSALATRWFVLFVLLSAAFLFVAWNRALGVSDQSLRFRRRAQETGLWVWAALLMLAGLAIFWRFSFWWTATLFGVIYLGIGGWHLWWLQRRRTESSLLFRQVVALSVLPILFAWIVDSTAYQVYSGTVSRLRLGAYDEGVLATRRNQRRAEIGAADRSVALALSGGGYRAAAVHAGILSVLEEARVPVAYLSTVSGGSIVGASYAMGLSAGDFRDHLEAAKPGLPNDLINFYSVLAQLFVPGLGSGDTYARHFDRVYFRGRRLSETGPPNLIVNATRYRDGTRRAFDAENDGELPLARLVAASGAFPVAFDPVMIEAERYIDGGVVENLGIAGLQQYFARHSDDPDLRERIPSVLILSDASLIPEVPPSWNKPSVVQMALRAQQTSYFSMHRWIYSFYTDGAYDRAGSGPIEQPFEVTAGRLWPSLPVALQSRMVAVFVFSPSSPGERARYAGHEALLDAVSDLDTLRELSPAEVDAAFWVGAMLGAAYLPEVCTAAGIECPAVRAGPAPEL
jgi:predicted acylesterase/phospholipase RssA